MLTEDFAEICGLADCFLDVFGIGDEHAFEITHATEIAIKLVDAQSHYRTRFAVLQLRRSPVIVIASTICAMHAVRTI
ncbi:hypothetical protein D3C86_1838860 [compost metagenome]